MDQHEARLPHSCLSPTMAHSPAATAPTAFLLRGSAMIRGRPSNHFSPPNAQHREWKVGWVAPAGSKLTGQLNVFDQAGNHLGVLNRAADTDEPDEGR